MKKVISYSGGIDSTARATQLMREHPEVEWTLCLIDMKQTTIDKQISAMDELVRRFPAFKKAVIKLDFGFNPTEVVGNTVIHQRGGFPFIFMLAGRYAAQIGADEVYTAYDRWNENLQRNFAGLVNSGNIVMERPTFTHFGEKPRGIQGTLDATGCTWDDVSFSISCNGDPSDVENKDKVPCGVCSKCLLRKSFEANYAENK